MVFLVSHAHAAAPTCPPWSPTNGTQGSNSAPLDIPVGDRSGPVTEIAGRIGVAVHPYSTWGRPIGAP